MKRIMMIGLFSLMGMVGLAEEMRPDPHPHRHHSAIKRIEPPVERIVVADYGALDTLEALGVSAKVVGMPKQMLPHYLTQFQDGQYQDVGGLKSLDIEAIAALSPDLIIISGRQEGSFQALNEIAPTYRYRFKPRHYFRSFIHNVGALAYALGLETEGEEAINQLKKTLRADRELIANSSLKAVVLLHNDEKLFASSTNRIADFIHNVVGVKSADEGLRRRSELVTSLYLHQINPDIIYLIDRSGVIGREPFDPTYFNSGAIAGVSAIEHGRIIYLTSDLWYFGGDGLMSVPLQMAEVMAPFYAEKAEMEQDNKALKRD